MLLFILSMPHVTILRPGHLKKCHVAEQCPKSNQVYIYYLSVVYGVSTWELLDSDSPIICVFKYK